MSRIPPLSTVKKFTRRAAIGTMAAGIPAGIWARYIEPEWLSITRKEMNLPEWPKALDGFRVAQLTDIHFNVGLEDDLMKGIISVLEEEKPDLITLTGDFVNRNSDELHVLCQQYLKKLTSTHGVYASPGNHDVWHCSPGQLRKEIESAGLGYLENQGTTITVKGENIFLTGLDSIWGGHPDARDAWKGHKKGDPVIAMVHEPDLFDHLYMSHPLSLQLSGHTHGGQCAVPFTGYAPVKVKYGKNYIYGHFQKNLRRSQLWVGRGIGTGGWRLRFAARPELVILTLRAA